MREAITVHNFEYRVSYISVEFFFLVLTLESRTIDTGISSALRSNAIMPFEEMSDLILDRKVRFFLYNKQIDLQRFGIRVVFFLEDEILSVV